MKNLETLIQELCPDGVEFVKLGDVCEIKRGIRVVKKDLQETGKIPVYQNSLVPLGYKDEFNYPSNVAFVISAGAAGDVGYSEIPFWAADDCLTITCPSNIENKYVYYFLKNYEYKLKSKVRKASIPRLSRKVVDDLEFPLPPIEVQTEIVRILDKFTSLEAELEAELDCRKRQYEYYRDKLLSFDNVGGQEVEWKKIWEFCDTLSGFPFDSSKFQTSGIKLMRGKNVKRGYFDFNEDDDRYWESSDGLEKYLLQDKDIIISMDGSLVGKSFAMLSKKHLPLLLVQRVARVRAKGVNQNYLFHNIAHRFSGYVDKKKTGGAIPHVSMKDIQNFSIPVPSLQEQERIANILDRFESLTTSLQSGLPAEISARRQQYEHYRDKLLTFKRKGAA